MRRVLYEDDVKGAGYESTLNGQQVTTADPSARDTLLSSQVHRGEMPNKRVEFNSILKPTSQLVKKRGDNLMITKEAASPHEAT